MVDEEAAPKDRVQREQVWGDPLDAAWRNCINSRSHLPSLSSPIPATISTAKAGTGKVWMRARKVGKEVKLDTV